VSWLSDAGGTTVPFTEPPKHSTRISVLTSSGFSIVRRCVCWPAVDVPFRQHSDEPSDQSHVPEVGAVLHIRPQLTTEGTHEQNIYACCRDLAHSDERLAGGSGARSIGGRRLLDRGADRTTRFRTRGVTMSRCDSRSRPSSASRPTAHTAHRRGGWTDPRRAQQSHCSWAK
jgi:hypothetical protein